jgi:hypothetical protein
LFKDFSKLLVCSGLISNTAKTDTCEVISLDSPAKTCKNLPNFPEKVFEAFGGLGLNDNPVICTFTSCYTLKNNAWASSVSLKSPRYSAVATQLQDGTLLVTGDTLENGYLFDSVELLTEVGWESKIPSLPIPLYSHCVVVVSSTTVMVIGGYYKDGIKDVTSGRTFYFNFGKGKWTEGPALKNARRDHSCTTIRRDKDSQSMSIIVSGGFDVDLAQLSSVEILDEGSNVWRAGPEFPIKISYHQMITDKNGGAVVIGGFMDPKVYLDTLYQLPHAGQDAKWTLMKQKLKLTRAWAPTFLVPDNIVDCS